MEEGDEIVQVNYQTVVGWERKHVLELFRESPNEVLLTLKRRPRHTKVYGQIYIKPYRLPSNKKTPYTTRWQHNLPSPRLELLTIPDFTMPLPRHIPKNPSPEPVSILDTVSSMLDTMATDSSESDTEADPPLSIRLYSEKPRSLVQRRATITGTSPTTKHGIDIEQFWRELKQEHNTTFQLRDKAASCAHGLDTVPSSLRPQTCLGIEQTRRRKKIDGLEDKTVQFQERFNELENAHQDETKKLNDSKKGVQFVHNYAKDASSSNKISHGQVPQENNDIINNLNGAIVPLGECISLVNDKFNISQIMQSNKQANTFSGKKRGKLDKSHSTPAYDFVESSETGEKLKSLENNHNKTNSSKADLKNVSTTSLNKTDFHKSLNNPDDINKVLIEIKPEQNESICLNFTGNVAQKISDFEKTLKNSNNSEEKTKVPDLNDSLKKSLHININDVPSKSNIEVNQSSIISPVKTTETSHNNITNNIQENTAKLINLNHGKEDSVYMDNLDREKCKDELKFATSLIEESWKTEYDVDLMRYEKILQTIDDTITDHSKEKEKVFSKISIKQSNNNLNEERFDESPVLAIDDLLTVRESTFLENTLIESNKDLNLKYNDQGNNLQTFRISGPTKKEANKKLEAKNPLTPPEPPPRKYFTKPVEEDPKPNIARPMPTDLNKLQAVEKSKKNDYDYSQKSDRFEIYTHVMEKSTNFLDEHNSIINESKSVSASNTFDNNDKYLRDEKYESFVEKFGGSNHSTLDHYKCEHVPKNTDSPDGLVLSRQTHSPDLKNKFLEKDKISEKSVVNRAMMVARSIGLHGGLSKASGNSPKSNRKKNVLLSKKRNVSVKDMGVGDLEGWLTYRSRGAGGAWAKAWFILKASSMYRFKNQNSLKADCLIALTGFTVSQAPEVKSRKYAFKVYHTGTVFYFSADMEDSLIIWLDAISKATLGADSHSRNSGLFSETDESDGESKTKIKGLHSVDYKVPMEKSFGSLKKSVRKETGFKDHEMSGASLDRKYLRFLGARNQNVPVPTAQFRSYRRVVPTSTPNKKTDIPHSPDLQRTIAGSTFYGLSASQSATDMLSTNQTMGDYRHTTDRCLNSRGRRPEDLHGFITLEEFMLSQQDDEQRRLAYNLSTSSHMTPLTNDHVHIQHKNFNETAVLNEQLNSSIIYGPIKNIEEMPSSSNNVYYGHSKVSETLHSSNASNFELYGTRIEARDEAGSEKSLTRCGNFIKKKSWESNYNQKRRSSENSNVPTSKQNNKKHMLSINTTKLETPDYNNESPYEHHGHNVHSLNNTHNFKPADYSQANDRYLFNDLEPLQRRLIRHDGYCGSSGDLACHTTSETLHHIKKEVSISRKGSFNLTNRRKENVTNSDKNWIDALRRTDKKNNNHDKKGLKHVAQYQPPPIPTSPFEQDRMRAAFEMHLDKNDQVQKANRLKNLFGSKSQQKPSTLDLPKDSQKTLLGSPRLHRAFFRDKGSQQVQQRFSTRSEIQSPSDSGMSRSLSSFSANSQSQALSQSFSSVSSVSDWSLDPSTSNAPSTSTCNSGHLNCQKGYTSTGRNSLSPPTLPYISPPTSPPPDYPGLEYPPIFEPGTYSLTDASLLKSRSKNSQVS
ncbi:uncharacterized protein [Prorops nasuta]